MRKTLAPIIVWSALAIVACIPIKPPQPGPTPPPQPQPPQTYTVAATVHDQLGAPIAGAHVTLEPGAVTFAATNQDGYAAAQLPAGTFTLTADTDCCGVAKSQPFTVGANQNVELIAQRPAPPKPAWTKAQLMDMQGDLMIWAPEVGCQSAETGIRCDARGLQAGWVWSLTINRYSPANREKLYQAVIRQGQTHVAVQVVCDGGEGYHGLYPDNCVDYGKKTQTVINELTAHDLVPICAGVSPTAKLADGIDPASCPIAMPDWDNSCDADARLRAIGETFPRSTLLYVEMPTDCSTHPVLDPGTVPISVAPDPATGGHWIMGAQKKYPNFVGVLYEINTPDGVDQNLELLAKAHAWWRDIQEVWFESDTYWKFWEALPNDAQRAYNDNIMRRAPQLRGCMSGCSTHAVIPDAPAPSGQLGDMLDMRQAVIEHDDADIANWPVTTTITALDLLPGGVHVEFSKSDGPDRWPDTPNFEASGGMGPLQYSIGMCLQISGTWHCSAPIELWYGLQANGGNVGEPGQIPNNWFYDNRWGAMQGYQPKPGELVGFYVVAGDPRNHVYAVKERSNVVLVPLPTPAGARFRASSPSSSHPFTFTFQR